MCQKCGTEGVFLCVSCHESLESPPGLCHVCHKPQVISRVHRECREKNVFLDGILVAGDYHDEAVQKLIWNLKYNGVTRISDTLALVLTDFLVKNELQDFFADAAVTSVPLHGSRLRSRGFNQSELIARQLANNLGLKYVEALERTRYTRPQVDFTREQRLHNLTDCFSAAANPGIQNRKLILIDDVSSTGATLNECARAIRETNNPSEIWGLVAARN